MYRFQLDFLEPGTPEFESAEALDDRYETLRPILISMECTDRFVSNPRSKRVPLLRDYLALAGSLRREILEAFSSATSCYLVNLRMLNSRWSYPEEPPYLPPPAR